MLTATRPDEVRHADCNEIDLAATWTIPAERTKTASELRVPLSSRALEVLTTATGLSGGGLVFSSPTTSRALSNNTIGKLLKDLGIDGTAHGFRAACRSWCSDTAIPRDVAEAALGHALRGIEVAYARSDMLDRRRPLMAQWAHYLNS